MLIENEKSSVSSGRRSRAEAKAQSREALIQAAMALFPARGLDVSLDELCAHAGYTRGAFYQHFEDRDALIGAVTNRVAESLLEAVVQRFTGQTGRDLPGIAETALGIMRRGEYPIGRGGVMRSWQLLEACERSPAVRAQYVDIFSKTRVTFAELIGRAQRDGVLPAGIDATALATLLIATVVGLRTLDDLGAPIEAESLLLLFSALTDRSA